MKLYVGTINLNDLRINTKLKGNKRILFNLKKDMFKLDDNTDDVEFGEDGDDDEDSIKSDELDINDFLDGAEGTDS